jgi:hypothetical protein
MRGVSLWYLTLLSDLSRFSVAKLTIFSEHHGQHPRAMRAAVVTCSNIMNYAFSIEKKIGKGFPGI